MLFVLSVTVIVMNAKTQPMLFFKFITNYKQKSMPNMDKSMR